MLFFFTGLHPDYHRPTDDYDKINVAGMQRVTDFVTEVLDDLDDGPQRPTFKKTAARISISQRGAVSGGGSRHEPRG